MMFSTGTQTTNDLLNWSLIMYGTEGNPINLVQPTPPTTVPGGQTEGVSSYVLFVYEFSYVLIAKVITSQSVHLRLYLMAF